MATETEIRQCFQALQNELHKEPPKSEDEKQLRKLVDMGLFIGESVVSDIKRIADAFDQIVMMKQIELDLLRNRS